MSVGKFIRKNYEKKYFLHLITEERSRIRSWIRSRKWFYRTLSTKKRFHRTLSTRGTNFRAAQPALKCEKFLHVHPCWAVAERILSHTEHPRNKFHRTLSIPIPRMDFIAAEHTRKCLKVENLGRVEYNFKKSRVIGPWDHKVSVSAKKV